MEKVNRRRGLSQLSFFSVLALVFAAGLLYFYNIFEWRNYPDFGFGFRTATGVEIVGIVTEHGGKAGMRVGDRILEVNGMAFANIQEFRSAMRRELGEGNTYLLERNGQQLEATITNIPSGFKRSFGRSGLPFVLGLCYVLIGSLVFLMKPHQRTSWIFLLFTSTVGLFLIFLYKLGVMKPFWLEDINTFAYTFIPAVMIHLAFSFPEERRILEKHPSAQLLPYMASALLFLRIRSLTPTIMDAPKIYIIICLGYIAAGILLFLLSCMQLWLRSQSEMAKIRSKMILLGFAITVSVPLASFIINAIFRVYILPSFTYHLPFYILFPLFVGYSIVKHDLFDIDAIIKRTYGYVLTTGAIAGTYGLFVFVSNVAFGRFEITKSPIFPLIFVLAVVFFFNPVRNRMQRFIDRVFYRLEYDYQETVQKISETMRSLLNLDQIGKAMMDTALGAMFIDSGAVMLLNRDKKAYECLTVAGEREVSRPRTEAERTIPAEKDAERQEVETAETEVEARERRAETERDLRLSRLKLPADEPLIQKIAERKKEVTLYDIQEDPFFDPERESCEKAFDQIQATLVVPLVYEDQVTGLISLGEKKSGKFYRREDVNLLNTLANQGAVAIENAMLLEEVIEKERMEEELSIARDLQMSMLPATCPEIEGFEIAAISIPAREVGGDFYDFIEMGEGKAGLVVGDVTGKSVSGALVMAASRSVFRMLSEEQLTVGDIMTRANQRTKKDIKSGMFVALLYAVLNAGDRTLSLCSAGQTQPIHFCAETGEARLVQTEGDTFPLGLLEEAEYQETRLQLAPGDKIVFYTDGIVEAMNEKEEMFGFERLLGIVQGSQSMTADSLLKEIMDKVNVFAGGAPQHDDLTVIMVNATG